MSSEDNFNSFIFYFLKEMSCPVYLAAYFDSKTPGFNPTLTLSNTATWLTGLLGNEWVQVHKVLIRGHTQKQVFKKWCGYYIFLLVFIFSSFLIFKFFGCVLPHVGSWFPDWGSNPCPLHWENGVLITGPPGKSPKTLLKKSVVNNGQFMNDVMKQFYNGNVKIKTKQ